MLRRWEVRLGGELAESRAACDVDEERIELALDAFKLGLERDPFRYSEAFADESRRVMQVRDDYAGVMFTAYVVLYDGCVSELKWIDANPLDPS
jgi:hypothetical protein